jgi:cytochrome b involved in lipid metabolism
MKRATGIIILTLIIVTAVFFTVFLSGNNSPSGQIISQQNKSNNLINQTNTIIIDTSGISSSELSKHNSQSDCWVAYQGKVYDLTSFLPIHPGSARAIIPYCGTSSQFEQAFTNQHGTSQVRALINDAIYKGILK